MKRGPHIRESFVTWPDRTVQGLPVQTGALVISPKKHEIFRDAKDILVVQPGLPGDFTMRAMNEGRELVKENPDLNVVIAVAAGIREKLFCQYAGWPRKVFNIVKEQNLTRDFFDTPFVLADYKRQLAAILDNLIKSIPPEAKLHVAGHSYGAALLLYALAHLKRENLRMPASLHFLAPFVKLALDTDDPEIRLNIVNVRAGIHVNIRGLEVDFPTGDYERKMLQQLLDMLPRLYQTVSSDSDMLLESHRRIFGAKFYETLGDLSSVSSESRVQIVRGAEDPFIGKGHSELIANRLGTSRFAVERVFNGDGHDLAGFDFHDLIVA